MVYGGKPSKACENCRALRTKCDRVKPSCSQCFRTRRQCLGYRDELSMMFRDESKSIARRAHVSAVASRPQRPAPVRMVDGYASNNHMIGFANASNKCPLAPASLVSPLEMASDLSPSISSIHEDVAISFFLRQHVVSASEFSTGYLSYLPDLYSKSSMQSPLFAVVKAVSLASYSNFVRSDSLEKSARHHYGTALTLTNAALCSSEATTDNALATIILLAIYETVTYSCNRSMRSWGNHIEGASRLLKMRGRRQFQTQTGIQLFYHLSLTILLACSQRECTVPTAITELRRFASEFMNPADAGWKLSGIMVRFVNFRARLKSEPSQDDLSIIAEASEIDNEFQTLSSNPPNHWKYSVYQTEGAPDLVYDGHFHIYGDIPVAQRWNTLRLGRIYLHRILHSQFLKITSLPTRFRYLDPTLQLRNSLNTILEMALEICASVPQVAGYATVLLVSPTTKNISPWTYTKDPVDTTLSMSETPAGAGGNCLLWPLFQVCLMDHGPDSLSPWVINRLECVGQATGIKLATVLAHTLKSKEKVKNYYQSNFREPLIVGDSR